MQKIMCEMCGSNDLIKQDGVFVCQHCGTKYSLEEAKKLLGKIDVSGSTVKIDSSDDLNNLYVLARRAKADSNIASAKKYYDMIIVRNPSDWEATFFTYYYDFLSSLDYASFVDLNNCIENVFASIKATVPHSKQLPVLTEVVSFCIDAAKYFESNAVHNLSDASEFLYVCADLIESTFGDTEKLAKMAANLWAEGIKYHLSVATSPSDIDEIKTYIDLIKKYDYSLSKKMFSLAIDTQISSLSHLIAKRPTKDENIRKCISIGLFILLSIFLLFTGICISDTLFIILSIGGIIIFSLLLLSTYNSIKENEQYIAKYKTAISELQKELDEFN